MLTDSVRSPRSARIDVLIPVYNDWTSARILLEALDRALDAVNREAHVLFADDGSQEQWDLHEVPVYRRIVDVRVLRLRRNLGHQRAICVGLCYLLDTGIPSRIVIMDGDGEDNPSDVPRLLETLENAPDARIVFAERRRRSEGFLFVTCYRLYRLLHLLLVGTWVRVGNFSILDSRCLPGLCASPELWNHYAATAIVTRQPVRLVRTDRGQRYAGQSRLSFSSLVMHGLSALSVFTDRIFTRLLIGTSVAILGSVLLMAVVIGIRLTTSYAIPGWATSTLGILLLAFLQFAALILNFCFVAMLTRSASPFIPIRDYRYFVAEKAEVLYGE